MTHVFRYSGYELVKTDIVRAQGKRTVDFKAGQMMLKMVKRATRQEISGALFKHKPDIRKLP